jgi:hypothetical protein
VIHYRQTQVSWPTVVPLVAVMLILIGVFLLNHLVVALWLVAGVMALILLLFATMTVVVDDSGIEARFGIGVVRKRVPFDRIRSCQVVRNPWYYGWGIHFFPGGILYNASGLSAVELQLTNGRYVRIGSGEAAVLAAALHRAAPAVVRQTGPRPASALFVMIGTGIGVIALIVAAWIVYVGMQPPLVDVTSESVSVRNGLYNDTVPLRQITTVTIEPRIPRVGLKMNGFAAGDTLRGTFRVDSWGRARLYVNLNSPPFVIIGRPDGLLVVNFKDPDRTREMYAQLMQALDRSR